MRVYVLPAIFIQMIDAPSIPAFREAHVRGEHEWLRTAFWRMTKIKMLVAVVAAGLYLAFGNVVAGVLGGQEFAFPPQDVGGERLLAARCSMELVLQRSDDRRR